MLYVNFTIVLLVSTIVYSPLARRTSTNDLLISSSESGTTPDHAPPLCDSGIVEETCADMGRREGIVTSSNVEELLSASPLSVEKLWNALKLSDTPSCMDVCYAVVDYVGEVGVLPPASDMACYTVGIDVKCDSYVGPEILPTLGPKGDVPNFYDHKVNALSTVGSSSLVQKLDPNITSQVAAFLQGGNEEYLEYETWEIVERIANLFRIFPAQKPDAESALLETELDSKTSRPGRWPPGGEENTMIKTAQAKAYVAHAIQAFRRKATKNQMTRWFGSSTFSNEASRKMILHTLNSVLSMIDKVHFVPYGRECSDNTYAYVYPKAYKGCSPRATLQSPCTTTHNGKYVFYVCDIFFKYEDEMIETLVHEGSHHAKAYTEDVQYGGETAYGRDACKRVAQANARLALKNADNFCYYVQDVADEVPSSGGADKPVPVDPRPVEPTPIKPTPAPVIEDDDDDDEFKPTCMRSGPTGMHVKKLEPDKQGNCWCKFGSLTCYNGDVKKCPVNGSPFPNHAKFAASCMTCSCKY